MSEHNAGRVCADGEIDRADVNLVARTLGLARTKLGGERAVHDPGVDPSSDALAVRAAGLQAEVDVALEHFAVDDALRAVFAVVNDGKCASCTHRALVDRR